MRSRLAGYKVPRMYVPVTHMPLNSTQKPDKLAIRQMMNDKSLTNTLKVIKFLTFSVSVYK